MKLLLDQNISYRLVQKLEFAFPGTQHLSALGLTNKLDRDIWEAAKIGNYVIVTFDFDFYDLGLTIGQSPKIIWIRSGNTTTGNLEKLLIEKQEQIVAFENDREIGCLEIAND